LWRGYGRREMRGELDEEKVSFFLSLGGEGGKRRGKLTWEAHGAGEKNLLEGTLKRRVRTGGQDHFHRAMKRGVRESTGPPLGKGKMGKPSTGKKRTKGSTLTNKRNLHQRERRKLGASSEEREREKKREENVRGEGERERRRGRDERVKERKRKERTGEGEEGEREKT